MNDHAFDLNDRATHLVFELAAASVPTLESLALRLLRLSQADDPWYTHRVQDTATRFRFAVRRTISDRRLEKRQKRVTL